MISFTNPAALRSKLAALGLGLLASAFVPVADAQTNVALTTLYTFSARVSSTNADGAFPRSALLAAPDGLLYGTAFQGGAFGYGTVFKITTAGSFTTLAHFDGVHGRGPSAPLVWGKDGGLYGVTQNGGTNNYGTVFRVTTNGELTRLYSFSGGADGAYPRGLLHAPSGLLYGVTESGGVSNAGTIFEITTNGVFTSLFSFMTTNGASPRAPLLPLADGNGNFFGTTFSGGARGAGEIFKFSPQGDLLFTFPFGYTNGSKPAGTLLEARDGNFYGTTTAGGPGNGTNGYGSVFKMTLAGAITPLAFFDPANGTSPECTLIQARDGNFYGTTQFGSVFKMTPNGVITPLVSFVSSNFLYPWGLFPQGGLVEGSDGNLYGVTEQGGGIASQGTIYRINLRPEFVTTAPTNATVSLRWRGIPGQNYQLQYASNAASWLNLGGAVNCTNEFMVSTDPGPLGPQRFYRLTLLP